MLRIPAPGRIEDRSVDGSCNPYLAATAVLAAGLDGIERELDPGEPTTELNLHDLDEARLRARDRAASRPTCSTPPASWSVTTSCARRSGDCGSEDYVDYYVRVKQREWQEAHEQVTPWELERYLQLY